MASGRQKVVLLGMMSRMPVAGVVWQTVHYMVGLERLGCEVYYVETHARTPTMLMEHEDDDSAARAATFIEGVMRRFDFADRWSFVALHDKTSRCYGLPRNQLERLYGSAALLINLHGGTEPLPELVETERLVYLETDPVQLQTELHGELARTIDFLDPHGAFFTFAENYARPGCRLPVTDRYVFHPTRQPVVLDFWTGRDPVRDEAYTTVGNWRQPWREITFQGETYSWSKHYEFLKFLDLPARTDAPLELALSSYEPEDRRMLEEKGWRVRRARDISTDPDSYRDYICGSRGEFTVAKDQNVRMRTGWFSDRSATYLAAGRPVISQETGFSDVLPAGDGLIGFTTLDEAAEAIERVNADYQRHSRAASAIAREYFAHDVVLSRLLEQTGLELAGRRGRPPSSGDGPIPDDLLLEPVSRRPTRLADETVQWALSRPVPSFGGPAVTRLQASIVVPSFENLPFARLCLESVLALTDEPSFELIVVDNASGDGTREYVHELAQRDARLRPVLNSENVGFARACNQGLALARGEVLVLLNDDTIVTPGWLAGLVDALRDERVGIAGPATNRIGNEAEVEAPYEDFGGLVELARKRARNHAGELLDVRMIAMFCLAIRRDGYQRIGPLDERFQIGLLEDDDYSIRVHEAGLRVVVADGVFVHHFGETSFGKLVPSGEYGELLAENRRRFSDKWGFEWRPYERRLSPRYRTLTERIRELVAEKLPADATVLVVSRGDDALLDLEGRRAWHFPGGDEGYAGHHPADSADAVAQLEAQRERGGQFLVFPSTGLWWLDHYHGLAEHLETCYRTVVRDDECVIYALNGKAE